MRTETLAMVLRSNVVAAFVLGVFVLLAALTHRYSQVSQYPIVVDQATGTACIVTTGECHRFKSQGN